MKNHRTKTKPLRIARYMNIFSFKSVACCLAFLLALPSGWCCADFLAGNAEAASSNASCCQHSGVPAQNGDSESGQNSPKCPRGVCCCQSDRVVEKSVDLAPRSGLSAFTWSQINDATELSSTTRLSSQLSGAGPRLHLLQCVWRI